MKHWSVNFVPRFKFRVGKCLALAVDLDQSIGAMLPKLPVMVHQTWHSFMISS